MVDLAVCCRRPDCAVDYALRGDRVVARAAMVVARGGLAPTADGHLRYPLQPRRRCAVAERPRCPQRSPLARPSRRTARCRPERIGATTGTPGGPWRAEGPSTAGATRFVERLRLEWRPGTPGAEPSGRLTFRPVRSRPAPSRWRSSPATADRHLSRSPDLRYRQHRRRRQPRGPAASHQRPAWPPVRGPGTGGRVPRTATLDAASRSVDARARIWAAGRQSRRCRHGVEPGRVL